MWKTNKIHLDFRDYSLCCCFFGRWAFIRHWLSWTYIISLSASCSILCRIRLQTKLAFSQKMQMSCRSVQTETKKKNREREGARERHGKYNDFELHDCQNVAMPSLQFSHSMSEINWMERRKKYFYLYNTLNRETKSFHRNNNKSMAVNVHEYKVVQFFSLSLSVVETKSNRCLSLTHVLEFTQNDIRHDCSYKWAFPLSIPPPSRTYGLRFPNVFITSIPSLFLIGTRL